LQPEKETIMTVVAPHICEDKSSHDEQRTTHSAFGQISASRTQGHSVLYGSDFVHRNTIRLSISRSENIRSLNRDWQMPRRELIEIELSESQWASFVSSLNMGSGVSCTLLHVDGERMDQLPNPEDRKDQFAKELEKTAKTAIDGVKTALAGLDALALPKGKTEALRASLVKMLQDVESNMPFIAKQFGEAMETTVERAKTEINGYAENMIIRHGLESIAKNPLLIEDH
jgi:hypothetical protein